MFSYLLTLLYFLSEPRATQKHAEKKDSQKIILNGENMTQKRIALALKKNKTPLSVQAAYLERQAFLLFYSWPSPKRLEGKKERKGKVSHI